MGFNSAFKGLNKNHSNNKSKTICTMNMQNDNRKFGIQTAQRRTDNTEIIGVNWPTIPGRGVGWGESNMGIRSQDRKRGKIGLKQSIRTYIPFPPLSLQCFLFATLLLGRHKSSS
jgi:hypothetical protein